MTMARCKFVTMIRIKPRIRAVYKSHEGCVITFKVLYLFSNYIFINMFASLVADYKQFL
jgi:hypothetical protein